MLPNTNVRRTKNSGYLEGMVPHWSHWWAASHASHVRIDRSNSWSAGKAIGEIAEGRFYTYTLFIDTRSSLFEALYMQRHELERKDRMKRHENTPPSPLTLVFIHKTWSVQRLILTLGGSCSPPVISLNAALAAFDASFGRRPLAQRRAGPRRWSAR